MIVSQARKDGRFNGVLQPRCIVCFFQLCHYLHVCAEQCSLCRLVCIQSILTLYTHTVLCCIGHVHCADLCVSKVVCGESEQLLLSEQEMRKLEGVKGSKAEAVWVWILLLLMSSESRWALLSRQTVCCFLVRLLSNPHAIS
jgi:hypothetical protein